MNNYPKLHNAMWPGLVGKGPGSEPFIDLDTMLELTASAEWHGARFDGVDLFLADPHISIDSTDAQLKKLAEKLESMNLRVGSVVAPVWPPTGGGSAMGSDVDRKHFLAQVRKACAIGKKLREIGIRHYGIVRVDFCPSWWQPMQPLFFMALSQSVCLTLSGISLWPPNWSALGIFSIEYQEMAG